VDEEAESAHMSCLTVTWLADQHEHQSHESSDALPEHTHSSACRSVCDGQGRHSGDVGVFVSGHVKQCVELFRVAADASYLWLNLKDVVHGCPEVRLSVCYLPQTHSANKITHTPTTPYECM